MSDVDAVALGRWLADHDLIGDARIEIEIISGGASNLTIGVKATDRELVVRRPRGGAVLPVHAFCDDESVIGAPFYVMTRLFGAVPHDPSVLAHLSPDAARAAGLRFIDVLKSLHAVDIDAVGLGDAAKRTGYLERQVSRWTDQWHRAKEADDAVLDELSARLSASVPPSGPATIVHGDYRLGNVMYASEGTDIIGVFDWEMATLGDPLADVGYTLLWWGTTDRPPIHPSQAVADLPGFPTAPEVCELYGADPDIVRFHLVLAAFKLTIIGEGNRARARRLGHEMPAGRNPLAEWALDRLTQPGG
jgi:aminoglycoside phosphotransferase (APT) family kinase protein